MPDETSSLRAAYITGVQAEASKDFYVKREGDAIRAVNSTQQTVSSFDRGGVKLAPSAANESWALSLATARYGCAGDLRTLGGGEAKVDANRVRYERSQKDGAPIVEWYANGPMGLEHGFDIASAPACKDGSRSELSIEVELGGDVEAVMDADRDAVSLRGSNGREVARYADLFVRDATGRFLPSHLEQSGKTIRIAFDASRAVYPLTVDPLIATQEMKLFAGDKRAGDAMGASVAIFGNTAVLGVPNDGTKAPFAGAARVFVRDGTTWTQQAKLVASDGTGSAAFGHAVAISGNTILVSAVNDREGGQQSGAAYVFVREGTTWTEQTKLRGIGNTAFDSFGVSVGLSGDTAIIGAHADSDLSSSAGSAYIFVRSGSTWALQTKVAAPSEPAGPVFFGLSVSISGNVAVVGAPNTPPSSTGAAYVLTRSGENWAMARLTPSALPPFAAFGTAVSIFGDQILVGAPGELSSSGAGYVFNRATPTGGWTQQARLVAPNAAAGDQFGAEVAIGLSHAVLGAPRKSGGLGREEEGRAYIFERFGNTWPDNRELVARDGAAMDRFGGAVAIDDETVLIGSAGHAEQGVGSGVAYVYAATPLTFFPTEWTAQQELVTPGGKGGDLFGASVVVAGDTALVGAPGDSEKGDDAGAVYVFARAGSTWTRLTKFFASDGGPGNRFGGAVALSGDTAIISASSDSALGPFAGAAYVFVRTGSTWTERAKLLAPDGKTGDLFGGSVAISGNTALIGASGVDEKGDSSGATYVFIGDGGAWRLQSKLSAPDGAANGFFGGAVALSGDTALVGATGPSISTAGAAYVFARQGGTWSLQGKLVATEGKVGDILGSSVALSGDTAVVGAPFADGRAGAAYAFVRSGTVWTQQARLTTADATGKFFVFGASVTIDGDTIVVGADPFRDADGGAYVYTRAGQTWTEQSKVAPAVGAGADFGADVSLSGTTLFVGAALDGDLGNGAGAAYAYVLTEGTVTPPNTDAGTDASTDATADGSP